MLAVRCNNGVVRRERLHGSDTYGFLSDIKVKEAVNFLQAVHFR